ncbi:hypothetical protein [Actinocatenispora comari]|uniref:Uncharacterized protein n=1 Tax=Actinocatenispora comari TaxID=2807577 RepID=A0A8J4AEK9_9ACTN|nr:hypothetical protein [Actinocatenispora comari]GIL29164.1 hypothetical protein NUM_44180 [Actinocatenispora comari]
MAASDTPLITRSSALRMVISAALAAPQLLLPGQVPLLLRCASGAAWFGIALVGLTWFTRSSRLHRWLEERRHRRHPEWEPPMTHTLRQIRTEFTDQVLAESEHDPVLRGELIAFTGKVAGKLDEVDLAWREPFLRHVMLLRLMNGIIDHATDPGHPLGGRRMDGYSPMVVWLAAIDLMIREPGVEAIPSLSGS